MEMDIDVSLLLLLPLPLTKVSDGPLFYKERADNSLVNNTVIFT